MRLRKTIVDDVHASAYSVRDPSRCRCAMSMRRVRRRSPRRDPPFGARPAPARVPPTAAMARANASPQRVYNAGRPPRGTSERATPSTKAPAPPPGLGPWIDNGRRPGVRGDHNRNPVLDGAEDGREVVLVGCRGRAEHAVVRELDEELRAVLDRAPDQVAEEILPADQHGEGRAVREHEESPHVAGDPVDGPRRQPCRPGHDSLEGDVLAERDEPHLAVRRAEWTPGLDQVRRVVDLPASSRPPGRTNFSMSEAPTASGAPDSSARAPRRACRTTASVASWRTAVSGQAISAGRALAASWVSLTSRSMVAAYASGVARSRGRMFGWTTATPVS